MTALPLSQTKKRPLWLVLPAGAALAWNVFGLWQFGKFLTQTPASLMAEGMTEAQAAAYTSLPGWMTWVFAVGVIGGAFGTALLALQRRGAGSGRVAGGLCRAFCGRTGAWAVRDPAVAAGDPVDGRRHRGGFLRAGAFRRET